MKVYLLLLISTMLMTLNVNAKNGNRYLLEVNKENCTSGYNHAWNAVLCEVKINDQNFLKNPTGFSVYSDYFEISDVYFEKGNLYFTFLDGIIDSPAGSAHGAKMFLEEVTNYYKTNNLYLTF